MASDLRSPLFDERDLAGGFEHRTSLRTLCASLHESIDSTTLSS
ncbi:MAG: hypothetical protein ACODAF_02155 [Actinomycetota bacterium]